MTAMHDERELGMATRSKLLLAIFDARDEWEGRPLQEALVRVLEAHGIAGATVLSGITGYGAHRGVHRKGLIGVPHDKPPGDRHRQRGQTPRRAANNPPDDRGGYPHPHGHRNDSAEVTYHGSAFAFDPPYR